LFPLEGIFINDAFIQKKGIHEFFSAFRIVFSGALSCRPKKAKIS